MSCVVENTQDTSKAVDIPSKDKPPGGAVRVYSDTQGDQVAPASYVPYCDLAKAQLSYHGHRDCVRLRLLDKISCIVDSPNDPPMSFIAFA